MTTRKHPRTMQEAFGPYTDNRIEEPPRPMDWQDKVVLVASILTAVLCAGIMTFGG